MIEYTHNYSTHERRKIFRYILPMSLIHYVNFVVIIFSRKVFFVYNLNRCKMYNPNIRVKTIVIRSSKPFYYSSERIIMYLNTNVSDINEINKRECPRDLT